MRLGKVKSALLGNCLLLFILSGCAQTVPDVQETETSRVEIQAEGETKEEDEMKEETEEENENVPEHLAALCDFYNENYAGYYGRISFVDFTGDGQEELLIICIDPEGKPEWEGIDEFLSDILEFHGQEGLDAVIQSSFRREISVWQYWEGKVINLYEDSYMPESQDASRYDYYLANDFGRVFLIRGESCYSYTEGEAGRYKDNLMKLDFYVDQQGKAEAVMSTIGYEEFQQRSQCSIALLLPYLYFQKRWETYDRPIDYNYVEQNKRETEAAFCAAELADEQVLDYVELAHGDERGVFAITANTNLYYFGAYDLEKVTVWFWQEGNAESVCTVETDEETYDMLTGSAVYRFPEQGYYAILGEDEDVYGYNFSFKDGKAWKEPERNLLSQDREGRITVRYMVDTGADGNWDGAYENEAGMLIYDDELMEYGCTMVKEEYLESFRNCSEILESIEESLVGSWMPSYDLAIDYSIENIELVEVLKSEEDYIYLNYKLYIEADLLGSGERVAHVTWGQPILRKKGDELELVEIVYGRRREHTDLGYPVYYGADRIEQLSAD